MRVTEHMFPEVFPLSLYFEASTKTAIQSVQRN